MKRRPKAKKAIIGVTGTFGSGKSTVANFFALLGAKVIDADKIAHAELLPGRRAYKRILAYFGKEFLCQDRSLDRRKLALRVFSNRKDLQRLNAIVHGEVIRVIKKKLAAVRQKVAVLDAPLLIEANATGLVDKIVVVRAKRDIQIARLIKRSHLSRREILVRIRAQMPDIAKIRFGDFIIDNSGSLPHTKKQVERVLRKLAVKSGG